VWSAVINLGSVAVNNHTHRSAYFLCTGMYFTAFLCFLIVIRAKRSRSVSLVSVGSLFHLQVKNYMSAPAVNLLTKFQTCPTWCMAWCSGNIGYSTLGQVSTGMGDHLRHINHLSISLSRPGHLSLLPSAGWEMSTSRSAVMLCGWGVKAGMVHSTCG